MSLSIKPASCKVSLIASAIPKSSLVASPLVILLRAIKKVNCPRQKASLLSEPFIIASAYLFMLFSMKSCVPTSFEWNHAMFMYGCNIIKLSNIYNCSKLIYLTRGFFIIIIYFYNQITRISLLVVMLITLLKPLTARVQVLMK